LAGLGLAWLGLAWLGLAWLGLAWLGLAWLGLAWQKDEAGTAPACRASRRLYAHKLKFLIFFVARTRSRIARRLRDLYIAAAPL
jgi:hypothetical protein